PGVSNVRKFVGQNQRQPAAAAQELEAVEHKRHPHASARLHRLAPNAGSDPHRAVKLACRQVAQPDVRRVADDGVNLKWPEAEKIAQIGASRGKKPVLQRGVVALANELGAKHPDSRQTFLPRDVAERAKKRPVSERRLKNSLAR